MSSLIRILTASLILATASYAEEANHPTVGVKLRYLDPVEAYQLLKTKFPEIGKIVKDIQIDQYLLTFNSDHSRYEEVRKKLAEMDVPPTQLLLDIVVTEIKKDSTAKVVGHPSIVMLEGGTCDVFHGLDQGRKLKFTIRASTSPEEIAAVKVLSRR